MWCYSQNLCHSWWVWILIAIAIVWVAIGCIFGLLISLAAAASPKGKNESMLLVGLVMSGVIIVSPALILPGLLRDFLKKLKKK